jgi:hypothetical protein
MLLKECGTKHNTYWSKSVTLSGQGKFFVVGLLFYCCTTDCSDPLSINFCVLHEVFCDISYLKMFCAFKVCLEDTALEH